MKKYIRHQRHKKFKHPDIKQKESPQKYGLETRSKEIHQLNPSGPSNRQDAPAPANENE